FLTFAAELSVSSLASSLTELLLRLNLNPEIAAMLRARADWFNGREATQMQAVSPITRTPYFCSGCPHNTSTKVPEGSRAFAGIGCHFMALWMDRNTETFTHMGGEGVPWVGVAPFTDENHVFANIGDGTYFHSGSLAIRQAVSSGANITYKILYNDATAMTGGQHVDGDLPPQQARHIGGSAAPRADQYGRLRRLRRLLGAVELHLGGAAGDRDGAQAHHQPVDLQQGLFLRKGFLSVLRHH